MRHLMKIAALGGLALLAACGPKSIPQGINDPYEPENRAVHKRQVQLDKRVIRPAAYDYGENVALPVRRSLANFTSNFALPGSVVNGVLQARPQDVVHNSLRFVVNTTVGIGGLFDPATRMGLEDRSTDFGETLFVWGVAEGPYLEAPIIGPTTDRALVGTVVNFALNPLSYVTTVPQGVGLMALKGLSKLNSRYTYGSTVDSILYDSADGYAQTRDSYLQSSRYHQQRFLRGGIGAESDYVDPYATPPAAASNRQAPITGTPAPLPQSTTVDPYQ